MATFKAELRALSAVEHLISGSGLGLAHVAVVQALAANEPLSNSDLADVTGLSAATISRCMERLTSLDMVRVALDKRDLRKNSFRLEARARSVLFEIGKGLGAGALGAGVGLDDALRVYCALSRARRQVVAATAANGEGTRTSADERCQSASARPTSGESAQAAASQGMQPASNQGPHDLSLGACRVLLALGDEPRTVADIADAAALGQSSVSMALKSLQAYSLVKRCKTEQQKADGRQRCYAVTTCGATVRQKLLESLAEPSAS